MSHSQDQQNKSKSEASELQFEQLAREFETEVGLKKLGDEAYKEAMAAKARGSILPENDSKK